MSKLLVYSFFMFLVSCSSKIGKLSEMNAPEWVFAPYSISDQNEKDNYLAGVGTACRTETGLKVQILKAEADARLNIAKQVGVDVNSSVEDFVLENQKTGDEKLNYIKKFQSSSQENIEKMPIVDSVRTNIWQNPKDDCIFIRVIAPKEPIKKYITEKLNAALDGLKDQKYKQSFQNKVVSAVNKDKNLPSLEKEIVDKN